MKLKSIPKASLTFLESRTPATKKFFLDENGDTQKIAAPNETYFDVVRSSSIQGSRQFYELLLCAIKRDNLMLIRGNYKGSETEPKYVRRTKELFEEPTEGTPWVMLDIDSYNHLPDGMSPYSLEACEHIVGLMPLCFHNASYSVQFSSSAGILNKQGLPLKPGFSAHFFFWLEQPIQNTLIKEWLGLHCLQTGWYDMDDTRVIYGIDPALFNDVQPHYVIPPVIAEGVRCELPSAKRMQFVEKQFDAVPIEEISPSVFAERERLKSAIVREARVRTGKIKKRSTTVTQNGCGTRTVYVSPTGEGQVKGSLLRVELKNENDDSLACCKFFFEGENSAGSWFTFKQTPTIAYRYGGDSRSLEELSPSAYAYVRDELVWFDEIPHQQLALDEKGFLPPISSFAQSKVSLILAPTGSGKTKSTIDWIKEQQQATPGLVVLYAAPRIALVNQMYLECSAAKLNTIRYDDFPPSMYLGGKLVVTTTNSLHKFLSQASTLSSHPRWKVPFVVVHDEIHVGMDYFYSSESSLRVFENSLRDAKQTLLLTGTLTDCQLATLPQSVDKALGNFYDHYCAYEFEPVHQFPLYCAPFDMGSVFLWRQLLLVRKAIDAGEDPPRVVALMPTSKLLRFQKMIQSLKLDDYAEVVSRPDNSDSEIEVARTSNKHILIASPVFSIGLNLETPPDILICQFDGRLGMDTSQIVQTINRGNRNGHPCMTYLFANESKDIFQCLDPSWVKKEIRELFSEEGPVEGIMDDHFFLDRATYKQLREREKNTGQSVAVLFQEDGFQNHVITPLDILPQSKEEKNLIIDYAIKAKKEYDAPIYSAKDKFAGYLHRSDFFLKLEELDQEKEEMQQYVKTRTGREMDNDQEGLVMAFVGLDDIETARKVNIRSLKTLFCVQNPWMSDQYDQAFYNPDSAGTKTIEAKLLCVGWAIEMLSEFKSGELDFGKFASNLNRNKKRKEGFMSLVSSHSVYFDRAKSFNHLEQLSQLATSNGTDENRANAHSFAVGLATKLLESIGILREKEDELPEIVIPENWNLNLMAREVQMRIWSLKSSASSKSAFERFMHSLVENGVKLTYKFAVDVSVCKGCRHFNGPDKCLQQIDVSFFSFGLEELYDTSETCPSFRVIPKKLEMTTEGTTV